MDLKDIGIFLLGVVVGSQGVYFLKKKNSKKKLAQGTAFVLRAKDCVMDQVTVIQENCTDIYEEAKAINEEKAKESKDDDDVVAES